MLSLIIRDEALQEGRVECGELVGFVQQVQCVRGFHGVGFHDHKMAVEMGHEFGDLA
jgi:hypothetical protein